MKIFIENEIVNTERYSLELVLADVIDELPDNNLDLLEYLNEHEETESEEDSDATLSINIFESNGEVHRFHNIKDALNFYKEHLPLENDRAMKAAGQGELF